MPRPVPHIVLVLLCLVHALPQAPDATRDCRDAPWPGGGIDLLLRTFARDEALLPVWLRSVDLFWPPDIGAVLVVLDDTPRDVALGRRLRGWTARGNITVRHEGMPAWLRSVRVPHKGRHFMVWSNLQADLYSEAAHIVISDVDAPFYQRVTPDLLFRDGRPVVVADTQFQYWCGRLRRALCWDTSHFAPELPDPGNFMVRLGGAWPRTVFPRYRVYLERQHRAPFDTVFRDYLLRPRRGGDHARFGESQFQILGTFLYHRLREAAHFVFAPAGPPVMQPTVHIPYALEWCLHNLREDAVPLPPGLPPAPRRCIVTRPGATCRDGAAQCRLVTRCWRHPSNVFHTYVAGALGRGRYTRFADALFCEGACWSLPPPVRVLGCDCAAAEAAQYSTLQSVAWVYGGRNSGSGWCFGRERRGQVLGLLWAERNATGPAC